jgi:hypothetical protein
VGLRLRDEAGTTSFAGYTFRRTGTSGAGFVEGTITGTNQFDISLTQYARQRKIVRLSNVTTAEWTRLYSGRGSESDGTSIVNLIDAVGEHRVDAAYTGLTLVCNAGLMNGRIRVIGYP